MNIDIDLFTPSDIDAAQALVEIAGWNQLPDDWLRLMHREPQGCFKATMLGKLVGTVTTIAYGSEVAWIGMMLVHPEARRQGVGTKLMNTAMNFLKGRGLGAIGLDATPAGRPLYEQLGFRVTAQWQRWKRDGRIPISGEVIADGHSPLTDQDSLSRQSGPTCPQVGKPDHSVAGQTSLSRLGRLDTQAFGVDRWSWIEGLMRQTRTAMTEQGYGLLRPGRIASYLGPLVATDVDQARKLVAQLLTAASADRLTQDCVWDVPPANPAAERLAIESGFEPVRMLYRMWLGASGPVGNQAQVFAISDPATG